MSGIIYGDFTCPFSYLASRRADLLLGTADAVEMRAVERQPKLPVTARRLEPFERNRLEGEWSAASALLLPGEVLPGRPPAFVPNTQAAIAGYAEAYGAGVADRVRRLLFEAFWVDGADIGNPEVLRVLLAAPIRSGHSTSQPLQLWGYAVSLARGPITNSAYFRIQDWQHQWSQLDRQVLPVLVDGNRVLVGAEVVTAMAPTPGLSTVLPAA